MTKIAFVHDFLTKIGGAEKVLLALHKIYPEAPIYTTVYDKENTKLIFEKENCQIITSSLQKLPRFLRTRPKFLLSKLPSAIEEFDFSNFDIVISLSNSFAHGIITKPNTMHICYCHSPMRYVWDWTNEYLEENHIGFGLKGLFVRNLLHNIRIWDKISSYRVDFWLANSKNVQDRIGKYYQFDSQIIYPPVSLENITPVTKISGDYYIIVSRLEPYKKIDLAIKAFNQSGKHLVVIGSGSHQSELQKIASDNIEFLGWQSDTSVIEYIKNAKAFIFPGEEDFGLTPVEAMACGKPVIAFKKGGVVETIIENKTGLFFDEPNPESLNKTIDQFEKTFTKFNPDECRKQSEKFSSENFAKTFKLVIEEKYDKFISNEKS